MAISIINILRNSLKFSLIGVLSTLIGLPVGIYVATILVPGEYGAFSFLSLWLIYALQVGPGIAGAGSREIPVLLSKDKRHEAHAVQNTSISAELLYTVIPFAVILAASRFYSDPLLETGLIVIAVSYMVARLSSFWTQMNFVREKFDIVAVGNLMAAIVSPAIVLASVHWFKVYALLIGPLFSGIITWVYNLKKSPVPYRFRIDWSETVRLARVGVVLQGLSLIFWAFRLADRTIIAATLPLDQLGLYAYAMAFLTYALAIFTDFGNVLQPIVWREAGKAENVFEGFKDVKRVAIYFALGTAVVIPVAQLFFRLLVGLITTKYIGSTPIFYALSYDLYLASMPIIPSLILNSSIVNKQNLVLFFYAIGLVISIGLDLAIIRLGYGVLGVAWVTVGTQGLVTLILYYFARGYISRNTKEYIKFQVAILAPLAVSILFYFFHTYIYSGVSNVWAFTGISLATQLAIWGLVIGVFYRDYLSISSFRMVRKEINTAILQIRGRLG